MMCRIIDIISFFAEVCDYKEVHDSANGKNYNLVLSHYPIFSWKRMGKGFILLYVIRMTVMRILIIKAV